MAIDKGMKDSLIKWVRFGFRPGSCLELLLRGETERAFLHAHPMLKPHWDDHVKLIEIVPEDCKGENFDAWRTGGGYEGLTHMREKIGSMELAGEEDVIAFETPIICPVCEASLNRIAPTKENKDKPPIENDITFCMECGEVLQFTDRLDVKILDMENNDFHPWELAQIKSLKSYIKNKIK